MMEMSSLRDFSRLESQEWFITPFFTSNEFRFTLLNHLDFFTGLKKFFENLISHRCSKRFSFSPVSGCPRIPNQSTGTLFP